MKTKPQLHYFAIDLPIVSPDGLDGLTVIGGPLRPSNRPGFVWLTNPDGSELLEAPAGQVRELTRSGVEQRLKDEADFQRRWRKGLKDN